MKIYTLTTFWLDDEEDKYGVYYKNKVQQGFWTSKEDAEKHLLDQWWNIHEYWNNSAVIEEYDIGSTVMQWKPKQWWYYTEDCRDTLPTLLKEVPEKMKFNGGRQTWALGR